MKFKLLAIAIAIASIQCSVEETATLDNESQDLQYEQNLNLSTQLPTASLDNSNKGLFVGTVVTSDLSFHQKIFINIENDGNINAQISSDTEKMYLLSGQKLANTKNAYAFSGDIGSFTATIVNNEAVITNAALENKVAVINTIKSTSTRRGIPSLGTFASNDGTLTGTWDFTWSVSSPDSYSSENLTIVKNGGASFSPQIVPAQYQRVCIPEPKGLTVVFALSTQSYGGTEILGMPLNYTVTGNSQDFVFDCINEPQSPIFLTQNLWDWNGNIGTVNLDQLSLPSFN